jgi:hypothetical protein
MEKQSKTEGNNTKWKVQIDGDKKYIDDLILVIETLNFEPFIYKEGENTCLESKIFDNIENPKDLSEKAKTFLTLISTLPHLKPDRDVEPLKISGIIEISDDGKEEKHYDSNGNLESSNKTLDDGKKEIRVVDSVFTKNNVSLQYKVISKDGRILYGLNTIESVKSHLLKIKNDSEALNKTVEYLKPFFEDLVKYSNDFSRDKMTEEISTVLSNPETEIKTETLKWVNLYKIYELIEGATGGERKLKDKKWVSGEQIDSFKSTSNYYNRHSKFKIFKPKPKERKMELSEAEQLLSQLLSKYIEEKAKPQGGEP